MSEIARRMRQTYEVSGEIWFKRAADVCSELDRLSLVIESAVRNTDLPNHSSVLAMLKMNREGR